MALEKTALWHVIDAAPLQKQPPAKPWVDLAGSVVLLDASLEESMAEV